MAIEYTILIVKTDAVGNSENTVHGSDSLKNARIEIDYFFSPDGICPRIR